MSTRFEEKSYNTDSLDKGLWLRIFKLMGFLKKDLMVMFALMLFSALFDVLFPLLNRKAINEFVINQESQGLLRFAVIYFSCIIMQAISVFLFFLQAGKIETKFSYSLREKSFLKLQELSFSYFDKTPLGWILARMTSDIAKLADILSWSMMDLVWGVAVMIGIVVVMFAINWQMALIVLCVVPPLSFVSNWFQIRILKKYREVRKINSKITGAFSEGINGAKTSKMLVLEEQNIQEFKELTSEMKHASISSAVYSALFMPIVMGLGAIATSLLLWYGGHQVLVSSIQFGTLMLFTQYASQFFEPLRQIARLIAEFQLAQASAERILSLLESEPDIKDKEDVIKKYGTLWQPKTENYEPMQGDIEFRNVDFHYIPEEPILKDFNLKVQNGQTVAIVGETGSGKSTLVNLLCRFYEPVNGEILIDGINIQERSLGWLHSNLGYVLQSPHLFSGTIKENIRFGRLDATDEEIIEAAKTVSAHDFIMKLDKGYDSEVQEGGASLSTGEKQLISFARAILADPKIFVLDEATSSIDTETEKIIQGAIENLFKDRTSFIIAHRLSTIVNADRILVMKKGKIVESGTHRQLLSQKGYYYQLYTNQFAEDQEKRLLNMQNSSFAQR